MKAITLHQPWASLIAAGLKYVETRSWPAPPSLIGQRIAIHAGKRKMQPIPDGWPREIWDFVTGEQWDDNNPCPLGMVVATANLTKCVKVEYNTFQYPEKAYFIDPDKELLQVTSISTDPYGDWSAGRYLWFLEDIEQVNPPVPATGRQGIWNWEPAECQSA